MEKNIKRDTLTKTLEGLADESDVNAQNDFFNASEAIQNGDSEKADKSFEVGSWERSRVARLSRMAKDAEKLGI